MVMHMVFRYCCLYLLALNCCVWHRGLMVVLAVCEPGVAAHKPMQAVILLISPAPGSSLRFE